MSETPHDAARQPQQRSKMFDLLPEFEGRDGAPGTTLIEIDGDRYAIGTTSGPPGHRRAVGMILRAGGGFDIEEVNDQMTIAKGDMEGGGFRRAVRHKESIVDPDGTIHQAGRTIAVGDPDWSLTSSFIEFDMLVVTRAGEGDALRPGAGRLALETLLSAERVPNFNNPVLRELAAGNIPGQSSPH